MGPWRPWSPTSAATLVRISASLIPCTRLQELLLTTICISRGTTSRDLRCGCARCPLAARHSGRAISGCLAMQCASTDSKLALLLHLETSGDSKHRTEQGGRQDRRERLDRERHVMTAFPLVTSTRRDPAQVDVSVLLPLCSVFPLASWTQLLAWVYSYLYAHRSNIYRIVPASG